MKKVYFLITLIVLFSCGRSSIQTKTVSNINDTLVSDLSVDSLGSESSIEYKGTEYTGEEYAKSISGTDVLKAAVTDAHVLIIAIDAIPGRDYDKLAEFYLNDALSHGANDIKMCAVVDFSTSEFQDGAVVGKRLGKAFK